jgi:hypothetical protein
MSEQATQHSSLYYVQRIQTQGHEPWVKQTVVIPTIKLEPPVYDTLFMTICVTINCCMQMFCVVMSCGTVYCCIQAYWTVVFPLLCTGGLCSDEACCMRLYRYSYFLVYCLYERWTFEVANFVFVSCMCAWEFRILVTIFEVMSRFQQRLLVCLCVNPCNNFCMTTRWRRNLFRKCTI